MRSFFKRHDASFIAIVQFTVRYQSRSKIDTVPPQQIQPSLTIVTLLML